MANSGRERPLVSTMPVHTESAPSKNSSYAQSLTRVWLILVVVAAVIALGIAIWFSWRLRAGLPQLHGSIRVPGLRAQVEVRRDARGVPHLRAQSLEDVIFAQAYVTAEDRLWQMDLSRRLAFGELSEIFGSSQFERDKEHRTLGFRQAARRAVEELTPDQRQLLAAYALGVNAYISSHRRRLPVEFAVLAYEPRPWTEADCVAVELNMMKTLNETWQMDLMREHILAAVGPGLYADLFPDRDPLDYPVAEPFGIKGEQTGAADPASKASSTTGNAPRTTGTLLGALDSFEPKMALGSNNWVVSGAHTRSGKPLLANDPHLGYGIPSVWYMIHLEAPGLDVSGVSLPGAPAVIIGHNQRIAWGFTNTGPDVQDLYLETFDPTHPNEYKVNGQWVAAEVRQETIKVRGGADRRLTVRATRHGPVVASERGYSLALQWTALQPHALTFPILAIDEAQNWQEFTAAIRGFTGPEQNMVYADVDGNIGYYAPGLVPIRRQGDGSVSVPGDTDDCRVDRICSLRGVAPCLQSAGRDHRYCQ